jgi:DNA-binding MarR family transcriptional regulator
VFRGTGLRATQFSLLAVLIQTGPVALTRLAAVAGLERTTLTRNLQLLEKRGLVGSEATEDGRIRRIAITRKGERLALELLPTWQRAQASAAAALERTPVPELSTRPPE